MRNDDPTRLTGQGLADSAKTQSEDSSYSMLPTSIPDRVGRYRVERELGRGGFGAVYLAFDDRLHRRVAIKIPHESLVSMRDSAEAYLNEARTVATLEHPSIVPIYDFGSTDDYPCFIVMKYIDGQDLRSRLKQDKFSFIESAELIATIASTLHHAHKHGIVHRDLKPGNILLDRDGKPSIVDFGLALKEQDLGKGPRYAGTAIYMSPEQARGEGHRVDGRSDIYNLGVVLYEMLVGRRPVSATCKSEILEQIRFGEVKPLRQINDAIPRELERICMRALAKQACDRYTTALDFSEDLRSFVEKIANQHASAATSASPSQTVVSAGWAGHDTMVDSGRSGADSSSEPPIKVIPKGLRSFESYDSDYYLSLLPGPHDREGLPERIRFWKSRIEQRDVDLVFPVGVLYGPSGCGKSSLMKAGLLPQLPDNITSVFLEASSQRTEKQLAGVLRKRFFPNDNRYSLPELIAAIRRGETPPSGNKVLLILDQFEQWLHGRDEMQGEELVEALRQCDGGRIQCLLLVRDDFWVPVSRFMRALEIPIQEGRNSAMVDLFDRSHAKKVLAAFGRAYERLPITGRLTSDQDKFLDLAVSSLSQSGRVICVQIALFAEMMKDRPWTQQSLRAVGGATGVGVEFLDQAFVSASAPPVSRRHLNAACAVLGSLLPAVGVDIKGKQKTYRQLIEAAGYEDRQEDFDELIHVLDTGLRLITPVDQSTEEVSTKSDADDPISNSPGIIRATQEGSAKSGLTDSSQHASQSGHGRRYQLTHDYLVQSLREWLTRRQRSSRRGRARLRLSEWSTLWSERRESRFLPSFWDWLQIQLFTRSSDWTEPQRMMMRQKSKRLGRRALAIAGLAMIASLATREINGRMRATSLTDQLLRAPSSESAGIIGEMSAYRSWVAPLLRERLDSKDISDDAKKELHLRLAMLPDDPSQATWLLNRVPRSDPAEISAIRAGLWSRLPELSDDVWNVVGAASDVGERLRLSCLVAPVEGQGEHWESTADDVIAALAAENSLQLPEWAALLRPAGSTLLSTLRRSIAQSRNDNELRRFAELYAEFSREKPGALAELAAMLQGVEPAAESGEVGSQTESQDTIESVDRRLSVARRQANVVTALAMAGSWDEVWPRLAHAPDPTVRTELIARLGINEMVSPEFAERLSSLGIDDASRQQAIVLILGEIKDDHRGNLIRSRYAPVLQRLASQRPAAGLESAIQWTLRQWGESADGQPTAEADDGVLPQMIEFGPGQLVVDDPIDGERQLTIERTFSIGRQEVSFSEYTRFRSDVWWDRRAAPNDLCPVHEVTWFDAAAYCNWLSKKAGLPESEWCYSPNEDGQYSDGMTIKPNALQLRGFRLPTANEWEYACRAGTTTYWSTGTNPELLDRYAWSLRNSGIHSHPSGTLRPNEAGLFDMHGNVWEWCHDRVAENGDDGVDVAEPVKNEHHFVLRGGTYLTDPQYLGSATRNWNRADKHTNADGFRVARTLLPSEN